MTDPIDSENEEELARRKKKKGEGEGEGDADSWGRGKAGAGAMVGKVRLPPQKLKEVMADWRHLDVTAVARAVAEYFSELPMRASANLSVAWKQSKSFALVNWLVTYGEKAAGELRAARERVAGRDSRTLQNRREQKKILRPNANLNMKPNGPTE
ncbi:MAG: hypothetical protein WC521_01825 [Bdellovibrionales bacterium]|jgi:hypothetical protein